MLPNYDLRNRFYHPGISRFLQPDPISFAGGNNLYRYCGNDSTNWTDPFGLQTVEIPTAKRNGPDEVVVTAPELPTPSEIFGRADFSNPEYLDFQGNYTSGEDGHVTAEFHVTKKSKPTSPTKTTPTPRPVPAPQPPTAPVSSQSRAGVLGAISLSQFLDAIAVGAAGGEKLSSREGLSKAGRSARIASRVFRYGGYGAFIWQAGLDVNSVVQYPSYNTFTLAAFDIGFGILAFVEPGGIYVFAMYALMRESIGDEALLNWARWGRTTGP